MWKDAALITISAVLFVQMGLSEAIQGALKFSSKVLSCPRCLSFWIVLAWSLLRRNGAIVSVAASFICAYCALWLALLYDIIATKYNKIYDKISPADTSEASADEVSKLQP